MEQVMDTLYATYRLVHAPKIDPSFFRIQPIETNQVTDMFIEEINPTQTGSKLKSVSSSKTKVPTLTTKVPDLTALILNFKNNHTLKQSMKGSESFEQAFLQALLLNPNIAKYKNFLTKTALLESGFNSSIQNTAGAPYYGYFLFGKDAIKETTNLSIDEFRNNPVALILAAAKLYDKFIEQSKRLGVYNKAKELGYNDDAIAAGAWLGGVGGVKKFVNGNGNPSDSKWYGGQGGTSVKERMNLFNA